MKWFTGLWHASQGQNLVETVLHVPWSLDNGYTGTQGYLREMAPMPMCSAQKKQET
jgi:hypothetical protein